MAFLTYTLGITDNYLMSQQADALMKVFGYKRVKQKTKKCAVKTCRAEFIPQKPMQTWCGFECQVAIGIAKAEKAKATREKRERAEIRARKVKLKTRTDWLHETEEAVNAYIRYRDKDEPCISCGRTDATIWNAGHFKSVGAHPELRFHPDNIHKQCARPCNKDKGGNYHKYREGLLNKIGAERLADLERKHSPAKYTIDDAKRIRAEFRVMLKQLKMTCE